MEKKFRKSYIDGVKLSDMDNRLYKLMLFIEEHPNWQTELKMKPYCLKIRKDLKHSHYFMFSYNMIDSDFKEEICKAARGLILYVPDYPNMDNMRVVVRGFDKFHNYGEGAADYIDWTKPVCLREKVDGSLIKCTIDQNDCQLHWYTNNGFDADAELPGDEFVSPYSTFQDMINDAMRGHTLPPEQYLYNNVLLFELISPFNRVVVKYDTTELVLLGARNKITGIEVSPEEVHDRYGLTFRVPKAYHLDNMSLDRVVELVKEFDSNKEGIVVEQEGARLKIKGEAYLSIHRMKDNSGQLSLEHVLKCIQEETIDDVLANFPEYKDKIEEVIGMYKIAGEKFSKELDKAKEYIITMRVNDPKEAKKEYAMKVKDSPFAKWCFELYRDPTYPGLKSEFLRSLDYEKLEKMNE